jgi:hypothetical protein
LRHHTIQGDGSHAQIAYVGRFSYTLVPKDKVFHCHI